MAYRINLGSNSFLIATPKEIADKITSELQISLPFTSGTSIAGPNGADVPVLARLSSKTGEDNGRAHPIAIIKGKDWASSDPEVYQYQIPSIRTVREFVDSDVTNNIQNYLQEYFENYITEYLEQNNNEFPEYLQNFFNEYFETHLTEIVNNYYETDESEFLVIDVDTGDTFIYNGAGEKLDITTEVRSEDAALDTAIPTEKAVRTAIDGAVSSETFIENLAQYFEEHFGDTFGDALHQYFEDNSQSFEEIFGDQISNYLEENFTTIVNEIYNQDPSVLDTSPFFLKDNISTMYPDPLESASDEKVLSERAVIGAIVEIKEAIEAINGEGEGSGDPIASLKDLSDIKTIAKGVDTALEEIDVAGTLATIGNVDKPSKDDPLVHKSYLTDVVETRLEEEFNEIDQKLDDMRAMRFIGFIGKTDPDLKAYATAGDLWWKASEDSDSITNLPQWVNGLPLEAENYDLFIKRNAPAGPGMPAPWDPIDPATFSDYAAKNMHAFRLSDITDLGKPNGIYWFGGEFNWLDFKFDESLVADLNSNAFCSVTRTIETTGDIKLNFFNKNGAKVQDVTVLTLTYGDEIDWTANGADPNP